MIKDITIQIKARLKSWADSHLPLLPKHQKMSLLNPHILVKSQIRKELDQKQLHEDLNLYFYCYLWCIIVHKKWQDIKRILAFCEAFMA